MNNDTPTVILGCLSVKYYSRTDEDVFFSWIKKIKSIKHVEGKGRILYLTFTTAVIPDNDLRDLIALFHRYNIEKRQLCVFLNAYNQDWFQENQQAYWHKDVFSGSGS